MKIKTKNAIYSILDLIDTIASVSFVKIDLEQVNEIREELLNIMKEERNVSYENVKYNSNETELFGVLSSLLLDKDKFPSSKDILDFAHKCLKINIKNYWQKRSRAELTGIIIHEVANQTTKQRDDFLEKWYNLQIEENKYKVSKEYNIDKNSDNFIDTWLQLYETK